MLINPFLREAEEAVILEHSMIAEVKVSKIAMPPLLADLLMQGAGDNGLPKKGFFFVSVSSYVLFRSPSVFSFSTDYRSILPDVEKVNAHHPTRHVPKVVTSHESLAVSQS
eukprot:scaffold173542_cov51-Attheya_sp.AAC.2